MLTADQSWFLCDLTAFYMYKFPSSVFLANGEEEISNNCVRLRNVKLLAWSYFSTVMLRICKYYLSTSLIGEQHRAHASTQKPFTGLHQKAWYFHCSSFGNKLVLVSRRNCCCLRHIVVWQGRTLDKWQTLCIIAPPPSTPLSKGESERE